MRKSALIIDGNSIINRAFFGIRGMATPDGFPTNALYGFLSIYTGIFNELQPDFVAVAFDLKGPTFRHQTFEGYKAGRKGMPDELAMQLSPLKEILRAMNIEVLELPGFEADDLLGTAAAYLSKHDVHTYLLTGDKDALQLVSDHTSVYYHGTKAKVIYDPKAVYEDMGVYPNRVTDLKGLMGDSSDNIPGIPSIGKVTANKLLAEFDSVEDLIARSEEVTNKRWRALVQEHAEQALLSKRLATIVTEAPIELSLEELTLGEPHMDVLIGLFQKYRLHSFLHKLGTEQAEMITAISTEASSYVVVSQKKDIESFFSHLKSSALYIHVLYDKLTLLEDTLSYMGLVSETGQGILVGPSFASEVIEALKTLHEKEPLQIKGHDIKQELLILKRYGLKGVQPIFDAQIGMYLIDANRRDYALSDLTMELFGESMGSLEEVFGKGAKQTSVQEASLEKVMPYLDQAMQAIVRLEKPIIEKMETLQVMDLFKTLEMPLVGVLADMEYEGFNVDLGVLDQMDQEISDVIVTLEASIYEHAGETFNINSPKQLGGILFDTLGLPVIKKTKTGYSTNHDVLMALQSKHAIIDEIIQYRTYTKLKSTYIDGLRQVINPVTGRVHSSLNQTVASTGRLSSTEPNLQNIPMKLEIGRRLRQMFIPRDSKHVLVDADYSQIELRVLAHMSDDDMLKKAYLEGIDIHALTASQVFDTPLSDITPEVRNRAKEVNFGIVYGMSDFGLSETLGITRKEAKTYIDQYFNKYPLVKTYMNTCKDKCAETGYSETILGRKRFIPEIKNKNFNVRQYGERMAMNTPIQGSAADIIKLAMLKVAKALDDAGLKSRLILQVHDELIIDTLDEEVEAVQKLLSDCMKEAITLSVPLSIDMHVGANWYDAK